MRTYFDEISSFSKNHKFLISFLLLEFFITCLIPYFFFFKLNQWFQGIFIVIIIPYCSYKIVPIYFKGIKGLALIWVFILIFIALNLFVKDWLKSKSIEKYNIESYGVIIDKKFSSGTKRIEPHWLIKVEYEFENKKYQTYFEEIENETDFQIYDTLAIDFSSKVPECYYLFKRLTDYE